mmetsp:Transcript_29712/g.96811  ORF Transcript_29712/g.96811 Transcript_29712/m.96811 type:complete len:247 (+) Transcript_29712:1402-2142(+)
MCSYPCPGQKPFSHGTRRRTSTRHCWRPKTSTSGRCDRQSEPWRRGSRARTAGSSRARGVASTGPSCATPLRTPTGTYSSAETPEKETCLPSGSSLCWGPASTLRCSCASSALILRVTASICARHRRLRRRWRRRSSSSISGRRGWSAGAGDTSDSQAAVRGAAPAPPHGNAASVAAKGLGHRHGRKACVAAQGGKAHHEVDLYGERALQAYYTPNALCVTRRSPTSSIPLHSLPSHNQRRWASPA